MNNTKNIHEMSDIELQGQIEEAGRHLSNMMEDEQSGHKGDWYKNRLDELKREKDRRIFNRDFS
jgi:hypothetical protein